MVVTVMLVGLSGGSAWVLVSLFSLLPPLLSFLATLGLASTTLAIHGLLNAVCRIEEPLHEGNLIEARRQLSHIVGRETCCLNKDKVLRASLESLAENTSDGIVAPPPLPLFRGDSCSHGLQGREYSRFYDRI
jgi:adenosylcobinamide-phosphate synthase